LPRLVKPCLAKRCSRVFASRAAAYDRENRFFDEDFEELPCGEVSAVAPAVGIRPARAMTLAEVCREQLRLAYHAPATALAVNMHFTGSASQRSLAPRRCLTGMGPARSSRGEIFACRHAESGNDVAGSALDHESRTRRRRLPVHGAEAFWQF